MPLMLATGSGPPAMSLAENPLVEYASTLLAGVSAGGAGLLGFVEFLPCRMSFIWPCDVAMVRGGFWRIIFPEMPICIHPCFTALYSVLSVGDPSAALANATIVIRYPSKGSDEWVIDPSNNSHLLLMSIWRDPMTN